MNGAVPTARSRKMQHRRVTLRGVGSLERANRDSQVEIASRRVFLVSGDAGVVRIGPDANQRVTARKRADTGLALFAVVTKGDERIVRDPNPTHRGVSFRIDDEEAVAYAAVFEVDHRAYCVGERVVGAESHGGAESARRARNGFPGSEQRRRRSHLRGQYACQQHA
jgi:hypothetical protein